MPEDIKLILFIVEGESDQTALETPIAALINEIDATYDVRFIRINTDIYDEGDGGDITTARFLNNTNVEPNNLAKAVYEMIIYPFFEIYGFIPEDIYEIIHIVDTDGAYIKNHLVQEVSQKELPKDKSIGYYEDRMICKNAANTIRRNKRKSRNMNLLSTNNYFQFTVKGRQLSVAFTNSNNKTAKSKDEKIITIPYSVYYFSSNLDHYIDGNANLHKSEKNKSAKAFLNKNREPKVFVDYFSMDVANKSKNYTESWEFIKEDNHSLQRFSNLTVLLKDHLSNLNTK